MRLQASITGAEAAQILLRRFRWEIDLLGVKDGVNKTFTTPPPEKFVQKDNIKIQVYFNGQRLRHGATNDFTIAESGGVGTGFDTIILAIAPRNQDVVTADYIVP